MFANARVVINAAFKLKSPYYNYSMLKSVSALLVIFSFFQIHVINAQTDSLELNNSNTLIGELKSMNQGVAVMETDYSDSDFKIDWGEIKRVKTETEYLITTSRGDRYNGSLSGNVKDSIYILHQNDTLDSVKRDDIVFLREVKNTFLSKLSASLAVGYNFTKADNLSQFSIRSTFGYRAKRWSLNAHYNDIRSSQDDSKTVKRLDAALGYQFYLKKNWYTVTQVSWLSNTEQNIELRTLGKIGIGKYIVQTNSVYWGLQAGVTYNNESFNSQMTENTSQNSAEGFIGSELNLYDVGDVSLVTGAAVYPSFTESGRWRLDYKIDVKYDLPLDFFINLGFTLNYDNQPVEQSSKTDYVIQTTFGWEL